MKKFAPFVLIGLPGIGKSTVSNTIIAGTETKVISTDKHFSAVRSNPQHPITQSFRESLSLKLGETVNPDLFPSSANFAKKYGMTNFRDLEEAILVDLISTTDFNDKILDLGGAAFDRENTRHAIKDKGITSIYLKADPELISANLYKDFLEMKKSGRISRGNYFNVAMEAELHGRNVQQALLEVSQKHLHERNASYSLADHILEITPDNCTVEKTAERVLSILEKNSINSATHSSIPHFPTTNEMVSH